MTDALAAQNLAVLSVDDSDDDDPVLLEADGVPVDTWREGYPYDDRLDRSTYELEKRLLQIELIKLQSWVEEFFTEVPNQQLEKLRWDGVPLWDKAGTATQVFTKPVMDKRSMDMYFTWQLRCFLTAFNGRVMSLPVYQ